MDNRASEAVLVAASAFIIWWLIGGGLDAPEKFSLRKLFGWTTIIALALGTFAVLARIKP